MSDTWSAALDYLYGLANWETRPPGIAPTFELDRIRAVLADLGDPHLRWPAVHVAGTNGKGSTCAMIASALTAAGHRTGLYTSPHLHTIRERVQVDGRLVSEASVMDWIARNGATLDRHAGLTTFEALTALAFDQFAARDVDVGVIEVGLGGRLDTTNVVRPSVSVLTPIDIDHTEVLGDTVAEIARDKCGIIRHGVPVVSAPQSTAARDVIAVACDDMRAPLIGVGEHVTWRAGIVSVAGQSIEVTLAGPCGPAERIEVAVAMPGAHQQVNAATAVTALHVLRAQGWPIPDEAVRGGLATARWPARFEVLAHDPPVIVDGAHNPHGARAVADTMHALYGERRIVLILGVSRGKDVDGLCDALLPVSDVVLAACAAHPRAAAAEEVADRVAHRGRAAVVAGSPADALARALDCAGPGDAILATGSLFMAADVRMAWFARERLPLPEHDPPAPGF